MVTRIGSRRARRLFIKEWMVEKGLNDSKVADRVGVDRVTVTRWRKFQGRLDVEKIAALAQALDIEPEELWRPPTHPSMDALMRGADADLQKKAYEIVKMLKTGT